MPVAKEVSYKEPKSVTIKKAANGYVITSWSDRGETIGVAKTLKEANEMAKKILGGK